MTESVVEILGIRRKVASLLDVARLVEQGLPPGTIDKVKSAMELNDQEICSALGVSAKTISRRRSRPNVRLSASEGDRLFRAAHLFAFATSVLGDRASARQWLRAPQVGLNNLIPLELMTTEAGTRETEDLLGRIEHGVLS